MSFYFCERCGYNNKNKTKFTNHLNRKFSCKPILSEVSIEKLKGQSNLKIGIVPNNSQTAPNDTQTAPNDTQTAPNDTQKIISCKHCTKIFTRISSLTRHTKNCIEKIKTEQLLILEENIQKIEKDNKLIVEQLENENKLIIKELEKSKNKNQKLLLYKNKNKNINNKNTQINNCNINNNITNNITINTFGEENLDFLPKKYITDILQIPFYAITKLITAIHFNNDYPENKNIRIKNKTHKFLEVINNNKWELQNKKQTIEDLIENIYYILNENYEQEYKNISPKIKTIFNNFKKMYKNKETKEKIDESAELVILNNS